MPEREQALLGAVVEVAADAAALLVGGLDHARARRGDLGLALAQGDLVAAALDLGGRARGEDRERGDLVVGRRRAGGAARTPRWPRYVPPTPRIAIAR